MPLNYDSIDDILEKYLPENELKEVNRILYGCQSGVRHLGTERLNGYNVMKCRFLASPENENSPRIVKVAAIQHSIVRPTTEPIQVQRAHIYAKIEQMIEKAYSLGANIVCLPETWSMAFGFRTREPTPWFEYAEDCENGPSTNFAKRLAQQYRMIIISPILERDTNHGDVLWNTAVVISERGKILGKQRKNHIPSNGESTYYQHGSTGHTVFDTTYGKIGISICYDRHSALGWMMYGINGAEIVFNTAATAVGEHWWPIEARSAAIDNGYYTVAVNRVGIEKLTNKQADGTVKEKVVGPFYGTTFISAPDGSRTKGLSSIRDGILYAELDLNLCKQMRVQFGFQDTQRLPLYTKCLNAAADLSYQPQIIPDHIEN